MARWLAQLRGDPIDLDELLFWFPSGPVHALRDGEQVVLAGPEFEAVREEPEVRGLASEALQKFSAIIRLLSPGFHPPLLGPVLREDDDGTRRAFLRATVSASARLRATLSSDSPVRSRTQAQGLLSASSGNRHLEIALLLWATPDPSWPRLYRLLEEIEAGIGRRVDAAGLCSRAERTAFTHTANSADAAGLSARHKLGYCPPPTAPLRLSEAQELLGRLLEGALRSVVSSKPGA